MSDDGNTPEGEGGGSSGGGGGGSDSISQLSQLPTLQTYQAVPSDDAAYGTVNFWDERYMTSNDQFDWYHPYIVIRDVVREFVKLSDEVLIIGCGNSRLGEDMVYDGYTRLTNLDFSGVVVELMAEEYAEFEELTWVKGNVIAMDFGDESFDAVLDKATIDSILCGMQPRAELKKALNEVERVLRPSGVFIWMSVGTPDLRLEAVEDTDPESDGFLSWDVAVHAVPKAAVGRFEMLDLNDMENYYYIYICRKLPDLWDLKLAKLGKKKKKKKKKALKELEVTASTDKAAEVSIVTDSQGSSL